MELSFSPEAKSGYIHISRTEQKCKTSGFGVGITAGPIQAGANFNKNKCVTLEFGRP
jgi:hypothetical protein